MGPFMIRSPLGPHPAEEQFIKDITQSSDDQPTWRKINALPIGRGTVPTPDTGALEAGGGPSKPRGLSAP